MSPPDPQEVLAYEAKQEVRKIIGLDTKLSDVFTKERIEACQKVLDDARASFFDTAYQDLSVIESILKQDSDTGKTEFEKFETIAKHTANIQGCAGLFGYNLIESICGHIIDYCGPGTHPEFIRYQLITDLAKMLRLALRDKITDESGSVGQKLLISLGKYQGT